MKRKRSRSDQHAIDHDFWNDFEGLDASALATGKLKRSRPRKSSKVEPVSESREPLFIDDIVVEDPMDARAPYLQASQKQRRQTSKAELSRKSARTSMSPKPRKIRAKSNFVEIDEMSGRNLRAGRRSDKAKTRNVSRNSQKRQKRIAEEEIHERPNRFIFLIQFSIVVVSLLVFTQLLENGKAQNLLENQLAKNGLGFSEYAILGANEHTEDQIESLLKPELGQLIYKIDANSLEKEMNDLDWVKRADVELFLPNKIRVDVESFSAVARWEIDGRSYVIDSVGRIIKPISHREFEWLPIVVGDTANAKFSTLLSAFDPSGFVIKNMKSAELLGKLYWVVTLRDDAKIYLPNSNLDSVIRLIESMQSEFDFLNRKACGFDFREEDRVAIKKCA